MDKAEDNRVESAADKKSNSDSHLADELLLLAVDGELPCGEAARVRAHLEACWSCRVRQEQIEEAIAGVVEYRNRLVKPYLPPPDGGRRMFLALLEQVANGIGRPSLWQRLVGGLRALLAVAARPAWITALAIAGFALFFFVRFEKSPVVSASELLRQAQASDTRARGSVSRPVVYQKLSIRIGAQSLTRTMYRDSLGKRQADHLDVGGTKPTEFQRVFLTAHWSWQDPLSVASFSAWRDSRSRKQDVVAPNGRDFLTLKTTAPDGSVREAELTVRASDYHPVAENLQLEDNNRIEITELAYEVLSLEAINPAIFAPETPALSAILQPAPMVAPTPSEAELAEAELQARLALHVTGADLGEQVEVVPNGHRSVVVRGLISTEKRKEELLHALGAIPYVDVRLQTVNEAAANHPTPASPEAPIAIAVEARPILQRGLEERFPNAEERVAFVNRALGLAQDTLAHAWALWHLQERYTREEIARLSRSSQQTLELLIRDHVAALRQQADAETELITPLLPAVSGEAPATAAADWSAGIREIFPIVEKMHETVAALIAGSSGARSDPESLAHDLQGGLARLRAKLPLLYKQVSGPFLKPIEEKP